MTSHSQLARMAMHASLQNSDGASITTSRSHYGANMCRRILLASLCEHHAANQPGFKVPAMNFALAVLHASLATCLAFSSSPFFAKCLSRTDL